DLPAVLRMARMLGRMFTAAEQADNAKVVVLSESLWRSRFGADRGVLGRSIRLDSEEFTVIGVVPRDFGTYDLYTGGADFWIPFHRTREYESGMPIARLRDGVSRAATVDELTRLAGDVATPANRRAGSWGYALMSVREMSDDQTSRALPVLLGAVLLVLLIAC